MATSYTITEAVREYVISDACERLKVTADFSNGETRSYHFPLEASPEEIREQLGNTASLMDSEAKAAKENAARNAAEDAADETAKALLGEK